MKYKAVIFDLDGTLLDTLMDIAESVNRVLLSQRFPGHSPEQYRHFIGEGPRLLIERALPVENRNPEMIQRCLQAYLDDYGKNCDRHTVLYEGIPDLLDTLVHRGVKLAVLTNKQHDLAKRCMSLFLSRWHFDRILGLRPGIPRKPHPEGALEIADHLGLDPSKILYLGDSSTDMATALASGMLPVGACWGFAESDVLKMSGARYLIDHPMELIDLI